MATLLDLLTLTLTLCYECAHDIKLSYRKRKRRKMLDLVLKNIIFSVDENRNLSD